MKTQNKTKTIGVKAQAGFQIWLLLIGIVAFAFVMQMPNVEGADNFQTGDLIGIGATQPEKEIDIQIESDIDIAIPPSTTDAGAGREVKSREVGKYRLPASKDGQKGEIVDVISKDGVKGYMKDGKFVKLPKESTPYSTFGERAGTFGKGLLDAVTYAVAVAGLVTLIGGIADPENSEAYGAAAAAGIFVGKTVYNTIDLFTEGEGLGLGGTTVSVVAGIVAAAWTYKSTWEEKKEESVEFRCMDWQAPIGGADCEKCNDDKDRPCSEYRCKSLGQACGIVNAGTKEEKCIWMNPHDTTSPGISADKTQLTSGYEYDNVKNRPPGSNAPAGMKVVKEGGGCIEAFTPITFSLKMSEPAQCKIDFKHTESYETMNNYLGDNNLYITNHSQSVSMPNTDTLNSMFPEKENDGEYNLYIRCRDGNGNENEDEFVVGFCVDKGPDLTPPQIKGTSIVNGNPVRYQIDNVSLEVYVNEPSQCNWDRKDAGFTNMENQMTCANSIWEINTELVYTCKTTLTGIQDRTENNFYFRCQDLKGNEMHQSYAYKLIGTQPLTILSVGPNETIGGSTTTVTTNLEVKTDNGFRNGEAKCFYSDTGDEGSYLEMFETGGHLHSQSLDLIQGSYNYYFKCVDLGGNIAEDSTSFSVFVDNAAPLIIRAYYENQKLKILTNEESDCRYSSESCNYEFVEGIPMPFESSKEHYAEWITNKNYYIKCVDKYNNQPGPDSCSIVVKPSPVI